jgi:hypothetical protein
VCERIEAQARQVPEFSEGDVDHLVKEVRREAPLSERSSTRRS